MHSKWNCVISVEFLRWSSLMLLLLPLLGQEFVNFDCLINSGLHFCRIVSCDSSSFIPIQSRCCVESKVVATLKGILEAVCRGLRMVNFPLCWQKPRRFKWHPSWMDGRGFASSVSQMNVRKWLLSFVAPFVQVNFHCQLLRPQLKTKRREGRN